MFPGIFRHQTLCYADSQRVIAAVQLMFCKIHLVIQTGPNLSESDKCLPDEQRIKLRCPPHSWSISSVMSNPHQPSSNPSEEGRNLRDRIARRWYLTVIVLLYIGLFTSFALDNSLLLNTNLEPSASGLLSHHKHQLRLDK